MIKGQPFLVQTPGEREWRRTLLTCFPRDPAEDMSGRTKNGLASAAPDLTQAGPLVGIQLVMV
jgi:hypothetical protein